MIAIGRRVIPLDDLPGQSVTIGPWTFEELREYQRIHAGNLLDVAALWELFVSHIEAHPFDVTDPREIELYHLSPIIERWTEMLRAAPPIRGRRH